MSSMLGSWIYRISSYFSAGNPAVLGYPLGTSLKGPKSNVGTDGLIEICKQEPEAWELRQMPEVSDLVMGGNMSPE